MTLVLFVLCSGLIQCALANRLRVFHFNESCAKLTRSKAVEYCEMRNMSLVTLYDEDDANFTQHFLTGHSFWIGLHKHGKKFSSWSNNENVVFDLLDGTSSTQRDDQKCGAIASDTWREKNCSETLAFMCYSGNISSNPGYKLIEQPKTWCQARLFCRRRYTDLVSISSSEQNATVIWEGQNKTFWIGLIHDQWTWEDSGCSTYRNWDSDSDSSSEDTVTKQSSGETTIHKIPDGNEECTLCSKGSVRIIRGSFHATWEEAFDHCSRHHAGLLWIEDQDDQDAVKQWLQYPESAESFWIGLRQSRIFGFWIWTSDRMVSYSNWENGAQPTQPQSSQCGAISASSSHWTDENCQLQLPFLCEEEISFMNP